MYIKCIGNFFGLGQGRLDERFQFLFAHRCVVAVALSKVTKLLIRYSDDDYHCCMLAGMLVDSQDVTFADCTADHAKFTHVKFVYDDTVTIYQLCILRDSKLPFLLIIFSSSSKKV